MSSGNEIEMPQPRDVCNPAWWAQRLSEAPAPRLALYSGCGEGKWQEIEDHERKILAENIKPSDRVVDIGCGYGRIIDLMPPFWYGYYLGVDNCQEMIALAKQTYPRRYFLNWDIRHLPFKTTHFEVAIVSSVRGMITGEMGTEGWGKIEAGIKVIADRILYLEYGDA